MSGLEVNKILAAIILVILIMITITHVGDLIVSVNHEKNVGSEKITETIKKVEISDIDGNNTGSEKKEDIVEKISPLLMNASIKDGQKIFKKCGSCHNYTKDSANKVGPNLWNIINRPIANIDGFAYSKSLSELSGKWTYEELAKFLYKPKKYAKGTKMNFAGLKKTQSRANLVLFLREQSDNLVPLP